jgi:hypothetical protein
MSKIGDMPPCDSPRYRDFVCSFGCAIEPFGSEIPCWGEIHPHHYPLVAQGGTDFDLTGLCAQHHKAFHDANPEVVEFIIQHGEALRRRYISGYLMLIEEANGVAPAPQRMQKKSTRANRTWPEPYNRGW